MPKSKYAKRVSTAGEARQRVRSRDRLKAHTSLLSAEAYHAKYLAGQPNASHSRFMHYVRLLKRERNSNA